MGTIRAAYLDPIADCNPGALRWALFLASFVALAALLPYASHQFGLAGKIFLPMHFAVLTAAVVIGFRGGLVTALVSPALSYAVSGMPELYSLLPTTIELAAYAVVVNIAARRLGLPLILSIVAAMIAGRIVSISLAGLILQNTPISEQARKLFVLGMPGIIIQLALVPPLSLRLRNYLMGGNRF